MSFRERLHQHSPVGTRQTGPVVDALTQGIFRKAVGVETPWETVGERLGDEGYGFVSKAGSPEVDTTLIRSIRALTGLPKLAVLELLQDDSVH